ncbi:choice-of-anchor V domain-containing protein [Methyloglobulus sp.]|uniref:choice-of-anchor V domain-containing protein n=1 Tax=Methyloglobulus sp. TaxID=2518622 RepID=UPI003989BC74
MKQNLPNPSSMIGRCCRVAVIITLVLVDFIGIPNQAHASRDGRNGFSGNPDTNGGATCVVCHAVGANVPNVALSGPTVVSAGTTHEFSVTINGGLAGTAGVNISVSDFYGTLSPKDSELHLIGTDLAHFNPKPFLGNEVTFSFLDGSRIQRQCSPLCRSQLVQRPA